MRKTDSGSLAALLGNHSNHVTTLIAVLQAQRILNPHETRLLVALERWKDHATESSRHTDPICVQKINDELDHAWAAFKANGVRD
jgi:hypothetical protein